MEARNVFTDADQNVTLSMEAANRLLEVIRNISTPKFDVERGQRELEQLENSTLHLSISASSIDTELDLLQMNFTVLNSSAVELLLQSDEVNMLAQELLAVAHGALALANDSVEQGNAIIAEARRVLSELQQRLTEADNFTVRLAEVIRNVELAENRSAAAEVNAEQTASEVMEVASTVNMVAQSLENTSQTLQTALEVSLREKGGGVRRERCV